MKTENMTFSEALEAMKRGDKVRREAWDDYKMYYYIEESEIENISSNSVVAISHTDIMATDWEIYTEPKPEPQFEIGELVMMRDNDNDIWKPKHFGRIRNDFDNTCYECMNGFIRNQCAKFDKGIVFTNKPAKQ